MGRDAAKVELTAALRRYFLSLGTDPVFEQQTSLRWASIIFHGDRHRLTVLVAGEDASSIAAAFHDGLGDRDFTMRGHILADIEVAQTERADEGVRLTIEALTVADE